MPPSRRETWIVPVASGAALVMLAQVLAGKAARDALFLASFGAEALPYAIAGAGIVSFAGALPVARALTRFGPARLVPGLFAASALLFVVEWTLIDATRRGVAAFLYMHLAGASALLVSGFWALLGERFDPHAAKRSLTRVASWAALGGMLGGLLSERVSTWFGLDATLVVMAGMHALCAGLVAVLGRAPPVASASSDETSVAESSTGLLRRTPYLRLMATASLLLAVTDALLDYAIRAGADATFASGEALIRFFGIYYTGVGVLTFVVQTGLTTRVVGRLGIGPAMTSLPVAVGAAGALALVVPGLPSLVALRGVGSVLTNSVYRTGFELLYSPLPLRLRRATKTLVDVGGQRLGDVVGAGLILAVLAALPQASTAGVVAVAVAFSAALVVVLRGLQVAYRSQLARNLQTGEISLDEMDTLARSVAETQVRLDRSEILARIHETGLARAGSGPVEPVDGDVDALVEALGDPRRATFAAAALRARGESVAGDLLAALSSPDREDLVKLLLPGLLEPIREALVVEALLATLPRESFEVRFRSVRAAARIVAAEPSLAPGRDRVLAALRDEIANPLPAPHATASPVGADRAESILLSDQPLLRVGRRLEHVCTLIALDVGRDLARSVLLGLHSADAAARGTALEYLEVSLPEDVRRVLPEILGERAGERPPLSRRRRAARQLEADLLRVAQGDILPSRSPGAGDRGD
jgi:ATP/ADP translocase